MLKIVCVGILSPRTAVALFIGFLGDCCLKIKESNVKDSHRVCCHFPDGDAINNDPTQSGSKESLPHQRNLGTSRSKMGKGRSYRCALNGSQPSY